MSVNTTNLIQGPGTLYTGVFGTSVEPADSAVNSAPAASGWTDVGGTDGGVTLSIDQTYAVLAVDQLVDQIGRRVTAREITLATSLAEPTLENLQLAINGGTAASGTGWKSLDPLNVTSATQPIYFPVIMDGFAPGATPMTRRVIARKCLNTAKVDSAYTKDKMTLIPVTFTAHYVSASTPAIHIVDQTA